MRKAKPVAVVCTYRVKRGKEPAFRKLLRKHWLVLNRLGVVAKKPRLVLRAMTPERKGDLLEIFAWKPRGFEIAHKSPAVLAIWEPMEQLCEPRNGHPATEFPHFEIITP